MPAETTPPRRKLHLVRWMVVVFIVVSAWGGWRVVALRSALKEARALGWTVIYTDPAEEMWKNWKAAFEKETWTDGVRYVNIPVGREGMEHTGIVQRLNPRNLRIDKADGIRDLSAFERLGRLEGLWFNEATDLRNIDSLGTLPALRAVGITGSRELGDFEVLSRLQGLVSITLRACPKLKNADVLGSIGTLRLVQLEGCSGLTDVNALLRLPSMEGIHLGDCWGVPAAQFGELRSAFPNAVITGP
ncbi:MAG: hypothetical protein RL088_1279 [Verrucomicrobiota bacterium]|jgi:hypothetical protein